MFIHPHHSIVKFIKKMEIIQSLMYLKGLLYHIMPKPMVNKRSFFLTFLKNTLIKLKKFNGQRSLS